MTRSTVSEASSDAAIEWFVRLRADDVTDLERSRFFQWLRVKREHQQAFIETLRLWEDLSIIREMDYDELRSVPVVWDFKEKLERARA